MTTIINLTPHALSFFAASAADPKGVLILGTEPFLTVPTSGTPARCREIASPSGEISVEGNQIPLVRKNFGQVEGLPEPQADTICVVSALTAQPAWAAGRTDVFTVGDPVRTPEGQIVGCRTLCGNPAGF